MTARPNPLVLDALQMLAERGVVPSVSRGGKHIKIRWRDQGRGFVLTVSRTPSDFRASLKSRAILRRLLNAG